MAQKIGCRKSWISQKNAIVIATTSARKNKRSTLRSIMTARCPESTRGAFLHHAMRSATVFS